MRKGEERLRFGSFELDPRSRRLTSDDGRSRQLEPQPARVLVRLLERSGHVVSREELYRLLWPDGVHVDYEHGLNYCVRQIRKALADDPRRPRYVETIPREGYRFAAGVEPAGPRRRQPAGWRVSVAAAVALALATAGDLRSGRPEDIVAAATSEARRLAAVGSPEALSRAVRRWEAVLAVEPSLASAHAGLASAWLALGGLGAGGSPGEAYRRASAAADAALALDPADGEARVVRGVALLYLELDWSRAGEELAEAVRLAPESPAAWRWYGRVLAATGRRDEAEAASRRTARLEPDIVQGLVEAGWTLHLTGQDAQAVAHCEEALRLRSDSYSATLCLLAAHGSMGNEVEATAAGQRLAALLGALEGDRHAAAAARASGGVPGYWEWLARWLGDACPSGSLALERAMVYTLLGERDAALAQLREVRQTGQPWAPFLAVDPLFAPLGSLALSRDRRESLAAL